MNCRRPHCQRPARYIVNGFSKNLSYHICDHCKEAVEDQPLPNQGYGESKSVWEHAVVIVTGKGVETVKIPNSNYGSNPPPDML